MNVCYFDPHGTPVYVDVATNAPPMSMLKPPAPDPWAFVPDGLAIAGAFRVLFGPNPSISPDGKRICYHKNVNEQEWREIRGSYAYHLFDRSRYPGDVGWYLVGDGDSMPIWAADFFDSGKSATFTGEIVEMADGRRNRWTHTNTLYGLERGGVCVQFDPRFPHQDYGPEKCYERHFNSPTAGVRWELWYTPDTPEARALPWGDRRYDVLKQEVESGPPVPSDPLPYIECPRLSVTDDPWAKPPDPPPNGGDMTAADIRRYMGDLTNDLLFGAIQRYHDEVLARDRPKEPIIKAADDSDFSTRDVTTGGAMGFFVRSYVSEFIIARDSGRDQAHASGDGYDAAIAAYRQAVNPQ